MKLIVILLVVLLFFVCCHGLELDLQQGNDTLVVTISPNNVGALQAGTIQARNSGIRKIIYQFQPGVYNTRETFPTDTLQNFTHVLFRSTVPGEDVAKTMSVAFRCNQEGEITMLDLLQDKYTSQLKEFIIEGVTLSYCPTNTETGDGYARYLPISEYAPSQTLYVIRHSKMVIRQLVYNITNPDHFLIVAPNTLLQTNISMKLFTEFPAERNLTRDKCFLRDFNVVNTTFAYEQVCIGDLCYLVDFGQILCGWCRPGYSGDVCTVPVCFGVPADNSEVCGAHGVCTFPDLCYCGDGFVGTNCTCRSLQDTCFANNSTSNNTFSTTFTTITTKHTCQSCLETDSCCQDVRKGFVCYDSNKYSCINNRVLCGKKELVCGIDTCYDPVIYDCVQNELLLITDPLVRKERESKYNSASQIGISMLIVMILLMIL